MTTPFSFWVVFHLIIFAALAIDLGLFNRKAHKVGMREAAIFSAVWISLALVFNLGLTIAAGPTKGLEFLTGYLIEYSLSVDNIFVFVLIFTAFSVPSKYQHRVLFWGILGALIFRGTLIGVGAALVSSFSWLLWLFGAFLVYTGIKMFKPEDEEPDLENNPVLTFVRRYVPVTSNYREGSFFVMEAGKRMATPLFLVLLLVEVSDVMFAFDSIPAIFSITQDPFIVYTSNVFAILGLRSLYFLLANIVEQFVFLRYGLAVILTYVGVKLLVAEFFHISNFLSLAVIVVTLGVSIAASILFRPEKHEELREAPEG